MLFLHETHEVVGAHEEEFEAAVRDAWLPALARSADARLLYFLRHAHGTGPSYRVVTLTAVRDAPAWGRLVESVDTGELRALAERLDGLRHDVRSKLLVPLPWSPLQELELSAIPTRPAEQDVAVFMEDTVHPFEGSLEAYVEAAGSHYAEEMRQRDREGVSILRIEAAFRTAFGSGRRREVVLWQRLTEAKALWPLVSREVPEQYRRPGTWMHDALRLRDQWESRLLRAARWSPLY